MPRAARSPASGAGLVHGHAAEAVQSGIKEIRSAELVGAWPIVAPADARTQGGLRTIRTLLGGLSTIIRPCKVVCPLGVTCGSEETEQMHTLQSRAG
jgi:hypothetical protein